MDDESSAACRSASAIRDRADPKLGELIRAHGARRVAHEIGTLLCLRERDHVADAVRASEQHGEAIHSKRNSTVRGSAVAQRGKQESELLLRFRLADAECAEHAP